MAFKKLDLDIVAEREPFDQFLTKRVEANIEATHVHRAHVGGKAWVSPRPKYGCVNCHTFFPLAVPLSGRAARIDVDFLVRGGGGDADHAVFIAPCVYNPSSRSTTPRRAVVDGSASVEVTQTSTPYVVTLSYSIPRGEGVVYLGVHIVSSFDYEGGTKTDYTSPHAGEILGTDDGVLRLDTAGPDTAGPWSTYSADSRYALYFGPHSGATGTSTPNLGVLDVLYGYGTPGSNFTVVASPTIFQSNNPGGDYSVDWQEIAWVEFYSCEAYEIVTVLQPNLRLEAGYNTSYDHVSRLHRRSLNHFKNSGASRCVSAQEDKAHLDVDGNQVNRHGAQVPCNDRDWQDIGAAFLWRSDQDGRSEVEGNLVYRNRFRVQGLVAVGAIRRVTSQSIYKGIDVEVSFRVITATRDAGSGTWDAGTVLTLPDDVGSDTSVVVPIQQPNYNTSRDPTLEFTDYIAFSKAGYLGEAFGDYDPLHHNLRGTWPTAAITNPLIGEEDGANIESGGCGLVPFSFEIEDEYLDDELRFARLQIKGDFYSFTNHDRLWVGLWAYIPCWTITPINEVY